MVATLAIYLDNLKFISYSGCMNEKNNNNNAGEILSNLRREAGLSQRQLAARAGVHYPDISRFESGLRPVSPLAGILMANSLNLSTTARASFLGAVQKSNASPSAILDAELKVAVTKMLKVEDIINVEKVDESSDQNVVYKISMSDGEDRYIEIRIS